jgi:hypothetical protein
MLSSIVDHAGTIYLILGIVALGLGFVWWNGRKKQVLVALLVVVGLAALTWLLSLFVVTDSQRLRQIIVEMAGGVEDGKPDVVFKHFARTFHHDPMGRADFIARAERIIRKRRVQELHVWDFDFEELSRPNGRAVVAFRVRVASDFGDGFYLFRTRFVLEDNDWRLEDFQIFNPVVNTNQPLQIPMN